MDKQAGELNSSISDIGAATACLIHGIQVFDANFLSDWNGLLGCLGVQARGSSQKLVFCNVLTYADDKEVRTISYKNNEVFPRMPESEADEPPALVSVDSRSCAAKFRTRKGAAFLLSFAPSSSR